MTRDAGAIRLLDDQHLVRGEHHLDAIAGVVSWSGGVGFLRPLGVDEHVEAIEAHPQQAGRRRRSAR